MSFARRHNRAQCKRNGPLTLDAMLFGTATAPNAECQEERRRILDRYRAVARELGERDPIRMLSFLREEQAGYRPSVDGPSVVMQMLNDLDALREVEDELRKGSGDGTRDTEAKE